VAVASGILSYARPNYEATDTVSQASHQLFNKIPQTQRRQSEFDREGKAHTF